MGRTYPKSTHVSCGWSGYRRAKPEVVDSSATCEKLRNLGLCDGMCMAVQWGLLKTDSDEGFEPAVIICCGVVLLLTYPDNPLFPHVLS